MIRPGPSLDRPTMMSYKQTLFELYSEQVCHLDGEYLIIWLFVDQ